MRQFSLIYPDSDTGEYGLSLKRLIIRGELSDQEIEDAMDLLPNQEFASADLIVRRTADVQGQWEAK